MFARRDNDETVVVQGARVLGILAMLSSTSVNARKEFVNRDVNAAIYTKRCAVLKRIPEALARAHLVRQPLRLEEYMQNLELIAGGRSDERVRRLRVGVYVPIMVVNRCSLYRL